jgi:diacylglycerol kinase family enzyme
MYFYIVEGLRNKSVFKALPRLKDELAKRGIIGEIVTTNPLKNASDLLELGLRKGYSTIVAVGDDAHINELAGLLLSSHVALGIIPVNASEALCRLVGVFNLQEALRALQLRKIREVPLADVDGKAFFLTHVTLKSRLPTLFTAIFEDFTLNASTTEIIIANLNPFTGECLPGKLTFFVKNLTKPAGLLDRLFKRVPNLDFGTKITTPALKIETRDPFPVYLGENEIVKTPATFKALKKTLRLVVAKTTFSNA